MWGKGGKIVIYLYHLEQRGKYGSGLPLNRTFVPGTWYRLTQRVKVNAPDKKDGLLQVWVDGELVLDRKDIRYRSVSMQEASSAATWAAKLARPWTESTRWVPSTNFCS